MEVRSEFSLSNVPTNHGKVSIKLRLVPRGTLPVKIRLDWVGYEYDEMHMDEIELDADQVEAIAVAFALFAKLIKIKDKPDLVAEDAC